MSKSFFQTLGSFVLAFFGGICLGGRERLQCVHRYFVPKFMNFLGCMSFLLDVSRCRLVVD